tara:strand:+ start:433 stop:1074 length:642 start_codon:yes stop_codon:yes gene_type:complete
MGFIGKQPTPVPLTSSDITDGIITTAKIVDDAVTGAKISNSPAIADGLTLSDGNLIVASGHGISFGATANASETGATMENELLDDYEEGSWTPVWNQGFSSITYDLRRAKYTRIGNMCRVECSMKFDGTSAGAALQIGGLPFTAAAGTDSFGSSALAIGYSTMSTYANNSISTLYVGQNQNILYFYTMSGGGVSSNATASDDWIEFGGVYPCQ